MHRGNGGSEARLGQQVPSSGGSEGGGWYGAGGGREGPSSHGSGRYGPGGGGSHSGGGGGGMSGRSAERPGYRGDFRDNVNNAPSRGGGGARLEELTYGGGGREEVDGRRHGADGGGIGNIDGGRQGAAQAILKLEHRVLSVQEGFNQALLSISGKENEKFDLIFAILSELQNRQGQLEESVRSLKAQLAMNSGGGDRQPQFQGSSGATSSQQMYGGHNSYGGAMMGDGGDLYTPIGQGMPQGQVVMVQAPSGAAMVGGMQQNLQQMQYGGQMVMAASASGPMAGNGMGNNSMGNTSHMGSSGMALTNSGMAKGGMGMNAGPQGSRAFKIMNPYTNEEMPAAMTYPNGGGGQASGGSVSGGSISGSNSVAGGYTQGQWGGQGNMQDDGSACGGAGGSMTGSQQHFQQQDVQGGYKQDLRDDEGVASNTVSWPAEEEE